MLVKNKNIISLFIFIQLIFLTGISWSQVGPCRWGFDDQAALVPTGRAGGVGVTVGDSFFLIGGDIHGEASARCEAYDPYAGKWRGCGDLPEPTKGACGDSIGNIIYLAGADSDDGFLPDAYSYDKEKDLWERISDLTKAVAFAFCGAIENRFYLAGGRTKEGDSDNLYAYDPESDSWEELTPMPQPASFASAVTYKDALYVLGGIGSDALYKYDPETDTWATLSSFPFEIHNAPLIAPNYPSSHFFWSFGACDDIFFNNIIRGYNTTDGLWYDMAEFGLMPHSIAGAAAGNFHDSIFIFAGGQDILSDSLLVFNHCAPYLKNVHPAEINNYEDSEMDFFGLHFDTEPGSGIFVSNQYSDKTAVSNLTILDGKNARGTIKSGLEPGLYDVEITNSSYNEDFNSKVFTDVFSVLAPLPKRKKHR